ncbi:MAG: DHHW family protein [Oscillospiraceae bacterium]
MRHKFTIAVFISLLIVFFTLVVIFPKDENSSKNENRKLADFPDFNTSSLVSGKFMKEFETYLSDNVGFRSVFTKVSANYESLKGFNSFGKLVNTTGDLGTGNTTSNQLLVLDDKVMEVYRADKKVRENYISMINDYANFLPDNINFYNILFPTQIDFLDFYNTIGDSEKESIDYFYNSYSERVKNINVYDTLKDNYDKGEYVYFRTDHHWTTLGAYYTYEEMAKHLDMPRLNIDDFIEDKQNNFLGHLYTQAKNPSLAKNPDTIFYYKNFTNDIPIHPISYTYKPGERIEYNGKMFCPELGADYKLFLAGDHPFIEINSDSPNDRTLLIIKDSYSNALIPWLTCGYNQVLVIDARTFDRKISDILTEYEVDDFIIANYIFGTNFQDYVDLCNNIKE